MLIVKLNKKAGEENVLSKILNTVISKSAKTIFDKYNINIIDDSKNIELICSNKENLKSENSTIELYFKKSITIEGDVNNNKQEVDRIISEIHNFCKLSSEIDNYSYLPLNMRINKKDGTK